jgi:tape measure domain-containing protein
MAKNVVQDWAVQVSWDDSKVIKGQKRLEALMSKVDKVSTRGAATQSKTLSKQNDQLRKQNALESQRLSLRKKIVQAEAIGMQGLQRERGALGGTNPLRIRQQILDLDKRITIERKKQRELDARRRVEQATVAAQPKQFVLPAHTRLKEELKIDNVVEQAKKGLSETSKEFRVISNEARRLKEELGRIGSREDLVRLQNQTMRLRKSTVEATAAIRAQTRAMNAQKFAARAVTDSIRNLARSYVSVFMAVQAGRAFFRVGEQLDSMKASLLAAGGSAKQAGEDFEFIKNESERLGFSLTDSAKGWTQIGAAGRASNLTMEETKEVWLAGTEAARAFGLDSQRLGFVHLALSQIISKGKVSMEELRRQLGEHLPGAMSIAAKAMNVTTMELEKMVEAGIPAEEFLPKFAAELRKSVRESGALAASLKKISAEKGRFANALQLGINEAFESGAARGVQDFFKAATALVKMITPVFKILGATIGAIFSGVSAGVQGIAIAVNFITSSMGFLGDITAGVLGLNKQNTDELRKQSTLMLVLERGAKMLVSPFLILFGVLQEISKSMSRLRDKFKFDSVSGIVESVGNLGSDIGGTISRDFRDKFMGESTKNTSNTFNATINVPSGSPEQLKSTLDSWWQATQRKGL